MFKFEDTWNSRMSSCYIHRSGSYCNELQTTKSSRHKKVLQHWWQWDDCTSSFLPKSKTGIFLVSHISGKHQRFKKSLLRFWCYYIFFLLYLQINLSYSSVTDVGLLSLANISCLQSFTVLHLQGLVPGGLAAALLACGGLTKVKLHLSLRPLLPQLLIRHVESRGCVFEWRDKEFQVNFMSGSCLKIEQNTNW